MDILYLNVKTVPAFDAFTHLPHTAYSVYTVTDGDFKSASAWTLKDAIKLFFIKSHLMIKHVFMLFMNKQRTYYQ